MSYPRLTASDRRKLVEAPFPVTQRVPGKSHAGTLIREVDNIFHQFGPRHDTDHDDRLSRAIDQYVDAMRD